MPRTCERCREPLPRYRRRWCPPCAAVVGHETTLRRLRFWRTRHAALRPPQPCASCGVLMPGVHGNRRYCPACVTERTADQQLAYAARRAEAEAQATTRTQQRQEAAARALEAVAWTDAQIEARYQAALAEIKARRAGLGADDAWAQRAGATLLHHVEDAT